MVFKNRKEAGILLAKKLARYKNNPNVVVYALPRGGVIIGDAVARFLSCPLDLVITRKIGHPNNPEYAIAAIAQNGKLIVEEADTADVDKKWLESEIERQQKEIQRRRLEYVGGRSMIAARGKIAILVDDGIATGLTIRVGAIELKRLKPQKIIIAVPVAPESSVSELLQVADEVIALDTPSDLGAIGSFYQDFSPVEDREVKTIMQKYKT
ncbi:MAG: phosphoribosyltransferase [Candidatus Levyibacteriota bacterium]